MLVDQVHSVEIVVHDLWWDNWCRYSGHQQDQIKSCSRLGPITYANALHPFLSWLAPGELIHLMETNIGAVCNRAVGRRVAQGDNAILRDRHKDRRSSVRYAVLLRRYA